MALGPLSMACVSCVGLKFLSTYFPKIFKNKLFLYYKQVFSLTVITSFCTMLIHFGNTSLFVFKDLCIRARERAQVGGKADGEGESPSDCARSVEPDTGLDSTTTRSQAQPTPRVGA